MVKMQRVPECVSEVHSHILSIHTDWPTKKVVQEQQPVPPHSIGSQCDRDAVVVVGTVVLYSQNHFGMM